MSDENNENIITDINDGKIPRKTDYGNKKPMLICFHGRAYRLKDAIRDILKLMKVKKYQDFYEKILDIRVPKGRLFSKTQDEIFSYVLISPNKNTFINWMKDNGIVTMKTLNDLDKRILDNTGVYVDKEKYKPTNNDYIIELFLAILEQFGYKEEIKIIFADEKRPEYIDIRSLEPIVWGELFDVVDMDSLADIDHGYLKVDNLSGYWDKFPKISDFNIYIKIIDNKFCDVRDGGSLIRGSPHMQQKHNGEMRISKKLYIKHGITIDSLIDDGRHFKVRCGFLYSNIRNHLIILDFQEMEEETRKKAEEETRKKAEEETRKKAEEETRKKAEEETRKLKHFIDYKKGLKEFDIRRKYEEFKKELKEVAVENLKKRREEVVVTNSQEESIEDFEQRSKQKTNCDEKSIKRMNEDTIQRIQEMNEDTIQRIQRMNEDTFRHIQHLIEDTKLRNVEYEKTRAEFTKNVEKTNIEVTKSAIATNATLESQNADLQTKVTILESQNSDLHTKVTILEEKTGNISFDGIDILIEKLLTKGFGGIEKLVEEKLLEVVRLRKLAEDDKTESIKNLAEADKKLSDAYNKEKDISLIVEGRKEVDLSIERKLREIKEAETSIKKETEKCKAMFADNQKLMNDIRKCVEIPQNYKAWRLEVSGMGRKESVEDIQKRILDIGIETNMYEVDQTRKKRKDIK